MITRPWLRAAFFVVWAGYLAWAAWERPEPWFLFWPMVAFALIALGIAAYIARSAVRQRGN